MAGIGRWFSPDTPASSTTKTGHHDIAESGVKHQNQIKKKSNQAVSPFLDLFILDLQQNLVKFIKSKN